MKKILLLFTSFLVLSCSSNDDIAKGLSINPPSWLQGTWFVEGGASETGFKFTSNDFCLVVLSSQQTCFKEALKQTQTAGANASVIEEKNNDSYFIEITLASQVTTYEFHRISSTKIEWVNDPLGDLSQAIYIKQ